MSGTLDRKEERLQVRATGEQRALIEQAAQLSGQSLSSFVLQYAVRAAQETVQREQVTRLSAQATEAFDRAMQAAGAPAGVQRLRRNLGQVRLPVDG